MDLFSSEIELSEDLLSNLTSSFFEDFKTKKNPVISIDSPKIIVIAPKKMLLNFQKSADNTKKAKKTDYFLEFNVLFCYYDSLRKLRLVSQLGIG